MTGKAKKQTGKQSENVALIIGAHVEEIEAEMPLLPMCLAEAGWRVIILNPIGGWNWVRLRKLTSSKLDEFKQSCYRAAEILGVEKIILDYDIGSSPGCEQSLMKDMARIIYDETPSLVFIPWAKDTHQDHRHLAKVSFKLLSGGHFVTQTDEVEPKSWDYEVWTYPAGISQSYDFWPDAVLAGDEKMYDTVKKANDAFMHLGKSKTDNFTINAKRKAHYWNVYSNGKPAEALKFVGPTFPLNGTLLKRALGKRLLPVDAGPLLCSKEYIE